MRSSVLVATVFSLAVQLFGYYTTQNEDVLLQNVVRKCASPFIELIWTCGLVLLMEKFEIQFPGTSSPYRFLIDLVLSGIVMTFGRSVLWNTVVHHIFIEMLPTVIFPIIQNKTGLEEVIIEMCYTGFMITIGCILLIYILLRNKTIYEFDVGLGETERTFGPVREHTQGGQGDAFLLAESPSQEEVQDDMELRELFGPPNTPGRRQGLARLQPQINQLRRSQRRRTMLPSSPEH